jgi:hypothetical protein
MKMHTQAEAKPATRPPSPGYFKFPHNIDIEAVKPSHLKMFVILERCCPFTSYCWHSNAILAKKYGCTVRQVSTILREMQEAGYLWRLEVNAGGFRRRAGIFLHVRLDPDRPVEDRPPPQEAIDRLWAARNRSRSAPAPRADDRPPARKGKGQPPGETRPAFVHPPIPVAAILCPQEENFLPAQEENFLPAQEENFLPTNKKSLSLKKEQLEGPGGSLDQRQRKDSPTLTASPVAPTPEDPAAAPAPAVVRERPPLTPGQEAFLASLDDAERAAFEAWPAARRAAALAPHAIGFDRVIAGEVYRQLGPPPPPPPPLPATTAELLEQLPGKPRDWGAKAAEALAQDFGGKKDRALWGEFARIAEAVRVGNLDPADVVNAHRQAMAAGIKRRGAKFWAALRALAELGPSDLAELSAPR